MFTKVWGLYFSGTGTTEKVVTSLANDLSSKLEIQKEIFDFTIPSNRKLELSFGKGDIVFVGVPVIAGRVPNLLLKYLDTLKGNEALAIPVVLYGNRNYDDALIELRNILNTNGFKPIAGGAFIGEHSFSTILGAGRPDAKDMEIVKKFATDIYTKISSTDFDSNILVTVGGETPIRPYYQPRDSKKNPIDIRKVKPKTNMEICTKCMLCAKLCPLESISFEDPSDVRGICMKCCACVKKCPVDAKYYDDANYLYHQHELEDEYGRRAEPEVFIK